MAQQDPNQDQQDPNVEEPGDTDDIVDRTGEQMPRQRHDGVDEEHARRTDDNPRPGRTSDW
jgi:hypothetical protein